MTVAYLPQYELEDTLGSRGPSEQRFVLPAAATSFWHTERTTDVAIVEAHRIDILSPTGQFKRTLHAPLDTQGGRGVSSRPLRMPAGVTSHLSDLIISDTYNHRLLRLRAADGRPLANATHGRVHFGAPLTQLRFPRGVATIVHEWPPHGEIPFVYVADSANHRVCAFALAPSLPSIGSTPTISLPGPIATARDASMVPIMTFGGFGPATDPAAMDMPSAVAVARMADGTPSGAPIRIFIADTNHDRVQEWAFSRATTVFVHVRNLGASGDAPGLFRRPVGLALLLGPRATHESSRLFVTERTGGRAQVFTASGRHLQILTPPLPGALGGVTIARRPHTEAAYDDHRLILVGRERNALFVYRRQRAPPPRFEHPTRG